MRRHAIVTVVSVITAITVGTEAEAADWTTVGGWGQAWGDDVIPPQPVPRRAEPTPNYVPPPAYVPSAQPAYAPPAYTPPARTEATGQPTPQGAPITSGATTTTGKDRDGGGSAQSADNQYPIHLRAEQIDHDRELDIVTARGSVYATQGRRRLRADAVTYNIGQGIVSASGNVIMVEPTGEVIRTEYLEMTDDFGQGIARKIQYMTTDEARTAAKSATRVGGNRTDFDDAVYTACDACASDPNRPPLWQTTAARITHDQENQTIEYHDMWLEMYGYPVGYLPYLSTPDPTVRRQSGFLTPGIGGSGSIGQTVSTPYFWVVSDDQDYTFTPHWLMSDIGRFKGYEATPTGSLLTRVDMAVQQRWSGATGQTFNEGSLTEDPHTGQIRGMIFGKGVEDLNSTWRAGYTIQRESDDTYNRAYGFSLPGDRPYLSSSVYTEGFWHQDYVNIETFGFQGITTGNDAPTQAPWVAPHAQLFHKSDPGTLGDYWSIKADTLSYYRMEGTSTNRVSNEVAWNLPYRTSGGQDWRFSTAVRTDLYRSDDIPNVGSPVAGRAVPTASVLWQYPFINANPHFPQTFSPLIMVAASPLWGNPKTIPNEDSIDYELDETSIFRTNRTTGLDRMETGLRGAYGFRWTGYPYRQGMVQLQMGQAWRLHRDTDFSNITDFSGNISDLVGRLIIQPSSYVRLSDRVRLDESDLSAHRNEAALNLGPPILNLGVSYYDFSRTNTYNPVQTQTVYGESGPTTIFDHSQQIYYSVISHLNRYWTLSGTYQENLTSGPAAFGWRTYVTYSDDCFAVVGTVNRNFTYDRDYVSGTSYLVNIVFKTFGQIPFTLLSLQ